MRLKIENKSRCFYKLEGLLLDGHPNWFYLYSIDFNFEMGNLLMEIGPNTNSEDRRKWFFSAVTDFKVTNDYGDNYGSFPKMIFGIDLNKGEVAVVACDDTEYSFKITSLPTQVYQ